MRILSWLVKLFIEILPTALFFFVAFSLVDATDRVVNKNNLTYYSFISCVGAALIMGKVVLIADSLSIIERYSHKPLIYVTLWKSFIYVVCSIVVRAIEKLVTIFLDGESFMCAYQKVIAHIEHPLFWLAQCWLTYLFIIFVGYRELIFSIGSDKVKKIFFGPKNKR